MVDLVYFKPQEFVRNGHNWFDLMDERLLVCVDILRHQWSEFREIDSPIRISAHPDALGRRMGRDRLSDHNIDKWGRVRAMDVMPEGLEDDPGAFRMLAASCGITAYGLYPHWQPSAGVHLGMRSGVKMGVPAVWGAIRFDGKQVYTTHDAAVAHFA